MESGADFSVGSTGSGLIPSINLPAPVVRNWSLRIKIPCLAAEDSESDTESVPGIDRRTRRRLSLIWRADEHPVESVASKDPVEEDDRDSVASGIGSVESVEEEAMPFRLPGLRVTEAVFRGLDAENLVNEFSQRTCVMHTVPRFLRGPFRRTLHVGLEEISEGHRANHARRQERGWKLFLLLPRMLLHRPPRGGLISRTKLVVRFEMFLKGESTGLIKASEVCAHQQRVPDDAKGRDQDWIIESPELKRWSIWASCPPPDKRSKGHLLHQEQMKHWWR